MKEIYLVLTQTGTILSRFLKVVTGKEYNHISISFDPELRFLYSFGRKNAYNPWIGGFVQESPEFGTFKRFPETRALVLSVPVSDDAYEGLVQKIEDMFRNKNLYYYDSLGLVLAFFKVIYKREHHFYCSDFVRKMLVDFGIESPEQFEEIVQPMHFVNLPDTQVIYTGKLREFSHELVS